MEAHGYSSALRSHYVRAVWLESPASALDPRYNITVAAGVGAMKTTATHFEWESRCNLGVRQSEKRGMEQLPQIGDRIVDRSAPPDDSAVRDWIGPEAFAHWTELRGWIDAFYPGLFSPEWIYGGEKPGWSLRYKKTTDFCTLIPEYKRLSVVVVLGGAERDKFVERRHLWRPHLIELYDEAQTCPDGKFLTITIAAVDDRNDVSELLAMKRPPPLG